MLACVLAASTYLVLFNLDQTHFWDDEAQVGMMAANLLDQGRITGWDGRNLFAYRNGRSLDENLRPRTPPLDYVVVAGSFAVFGRTTWAGRLPFAVAGLLTLALLALLARRTAPGQPWFAVFLVGCLGLGPLFVLNARQCRYNALCMLFATTAYFVYESYFRSERRSPGWIVLLTVSSVLLYYAHFLMAGAFLVALGVLFFIFDRSDANRRDWTGLVVAGLVFLAATLPYTLHHRVWVRPDMTVTEPWLRRHLLLVVWNLRDVNFSGMLPWMVAIAVIPWLRRFRTTEPQGLGLRALVLGLTYTVVIGLVSPQPTAFGGRADLRYLVAGIPILAIPVAALPWMAWRRWPLLGVAVAGVLVSCNAFSMFPGLSEFRWRLPAYLEEIHNPYPTAIGAAVGYLDEHAEPEDVVYAFPEENSYPLVFYCGDRLRLGCLLSRETPLPADVVDGLDAPLRVEEHFPRWIVMFGGHDGGREQLAYFSRPHESGGRTVAYRYVRRATLPYFWFATHRPELSHHTFGPPRLPKGSSVYVFEREVAEPEEDSTVSE